MKILIAEDEKAIADVLTEALPRVITGATTTVLADAIEMMTTMQTIAAGDSANWPDVVISDYHLIAGTGDLILQLAAKLFPNAKLIMMSGGVNTNIVEDAREKVGREFVFLQKPFALPNLVRAVQR